MTIMKWVSRLSPFLLLMIVGCGSSSNNKPPVNNLPVANAGENKSVNEETDVTLSGALSMDSDGQIVAFEWRQTNGETVNLNDSNKSMATFVTPKTIEQLSLSFQLTVTDNQGAIHRDNVEIIVLPVNSLPNTFIEAPEESFEGATIVLDGSQSADSDGNIAQYSWVQLEGPLAELSSNSDAVIEVTLPQVDATTDLIFQLTTVDNENGSHANSVQITVTDSITLSLKRLASPGRLAVNWSGNQSALSFNLYYASSADITPDNYTQLPGGTKIENVQAPFDLPAAFNDYQNSFFVLEAVYPNSRQISETKSGQLSYFGYAKEQSCGYNQDQVVCFAMRTSMGFGVETPELLKTTELKVRDDQACALSHRNDGTKMVTCWGIGAFFFDGEFGSLDEMEPVVYNPTMLTMGDDHACLVEDDTLICFGSPEDNRATAPEITSPMQVQAGAEHTCALNQENNILCWGNNRYGQINVPDGLEDIQAIGTGDYFSCAHSLTNIHCWGDARFGHLNVPTVTEAIDKMVVGVNHGCILSNHTVQCWGKNDYQQQNIPQLNQPSDLWLDGYYRTCALDGEEKRCWGAVTMTPPSNLNVSTPDKIVSAFNMNTGSNTVCVLNENQVRCWENGKENSLDHLGLNNVTDISAENSLTCAINQNESICWEKESESTRVPITNNVDQIYSKGSATCIKSTENITCYSYFFEPFELPIEQIEHVTDLATDADNQAGVCIIELGEVKCWEDTFIDGWTIIPSPSISNATQVEMSGEETCALGDNGIECWKNGSTLITRTISSSTQTDILTSGLNHACALKSGLVRCWTDNLLNQSTTVAPLSTNASTLHANEHSNCLEDDNGFLCWGQGFYDGYGWRFTPK